MNKELRDLPQAGPAAYRQSTLHVAVLNWGRGTPGSRQQGDELQAIQALLETSTAASVDAQDADGRTALMYACQAGAGGGAAELVELLARHTAGLVLRDTSGMTALMIAAAYGHEHAVAALIRRLHPQRSKRTCGLTHCSEQDHLQRTVLHWAVRGRHAGCTRQLLQVCDARLMDSHEETILHYIAQMDDDHAAHVLVAEVAATMSPASWAVFCKMPRPQDSAGTLGNQAFRDRLASVQCSTRATNDGSRTAKTAISAYMVNYRQRQRTAKQAAKQAAAQDAP